MSLTNEQLTDAILSSAVWTTKLEIWNGNALVASSLDRSCPFSVTGGEVRAQRDAQVRRTLNLEVVPFADTVYDEMFKPTLGYDYKVYRGILAHDEFEYMPLGVFNLYSASLSSNLGAIKYVMTGYDRSKAISVNKWAAPYRRTTEVYHTRVQAIVNDRTAIDPVYIYTVYSTPLAPEVIYSENDDPWEMVTKAALACGYEAFYDVYGYLHFEPIPDPLTTAAVRVISETSGIRIGGTNRNINTDEVFNGVIVRGSAPWLLFAISGEAWDTDPMSDTYYLGPFGKRPEIIDDATVTSQVMAAAAAAARLKKRLGKVEELQFEVLQDPRLVEGDIIEVRDEHIGVEGRYAIDSLTYPLSVDSTMSGVVRRTQGII